jgi:hypothetical protein
MTVDAASAPRARRDVVSARAGGHLLLFEPASRRLHALNASAALVWERLDGTTTAHAIATQLGERYASDRAVVEADVAAVIGRFAGLGLLAGSVPGAAPGAAPAPAASLLTSVDAVAAARRRLGDRPWAWTSGTHVALGVAFRVQAEDAAAGGALARVLRSLRSTDAAADPDDVHTYSVLHGDAGRWSVLVDGVSAGTVDSVDAVVASVLRHLDRSVVTHAGAALCFHGGAVQIGRKVVLLPGAVGSGTSTVTAALVRRGAGYVADQVAVFDLARGAVPPYLRPIGTTPPADPASIPGVVLSRGGALGMVVSPVHVPGSPTRVEQRTDADAVRLLLDTTYAFEALGADGFLALVALARRVPVYRVQYGDLDAACEVVLELARRDG